MYLYLQALKAQSFRYFFYVFWYYLCPLLFDEYVEDRHLSTVVVGPSTWSHVFTTLSAIQKSH